MLGVSLARYDDVSDKLRTYCEEVTRKLLPSVELALTRRGNAGLDIAGVSGQ